jgi:hypothetical protein
VIYLYKIKSEVISNGIIQQPRFYAGKLFLSFYFDPTMSFPGRLLAAVPAGGSTPKNQ